MHPSIIIVIPVVGIKFNIKFIVVCCMIAMAVQYHTMHASYKFWALILIWQLLERYSVDLPTTVCNFLPNFLAEQYTCVALCVWLMQLHFLTLRCHVFFPNDDSC